MAGYQHDVNRRGYSLKSEILGIELKNSCLAIASFLTNLNSAGLTRDEIEQISARLRGDDCQLFKDDESAIIGGIR